MPINHMMTKKEINPQMDNNATYILRITKSCLIVKKTVKFESSHHAYFSLLLYPQYFGGRLGYSGCLMSRENDELSLIICTDFWIS